MVDFKIFKTLMAGTCALTISACGYGTGTAPQVARAQSAVSTQQSGGLMQIADEMAAKGDHESAIPLYRHLATTTRSPLAITGLADSQMAMGNLESAFAMLEALVRDQSSPLPGVTFYSYGKAALALGDFDTALVGFTAAAELMTGDERPLSGKAVALAATGNTQEAISTLMGSEDPSSRSNLALVLAASGESERAIDLLVSLVSDGSAEARDRQNLAMAYLMNGREDKAYQIARIDLDAASVDDTFTFYRSLTSLSEAARMRALVTGTIDPEWTREETANLQLEDSVDRQLAATRFVSEPKLVAEAPAPEVVEEKVAPANYIIKEAPPLLEPEGWALQIGAYRTIDRLVKGWNILYERNLDILADIPPRRSEIDFGAREEGPSGFYYRLNAGPLKTLSKAREICTELRERGTRCWIRPPESTEGKLPGTDVAEATSASESSR
ncbi:MAG: tetratricopeptide repeat protein [Kordiimonadaceae bacterium]|nr:tetratricopeptide repeat protein [Kordiimonadaceae bacterium]MBO6568188.1 tetratricopeptide repeat protein [Kordiimonadaceae bacterium]MBO6964082.1 tetratricopeptide repeat protein [Kordiimonadaceae bacterium]